MRHLTLYCDSGLANRMCVLVSGRVMARAAGAELEFLWPLCATCNCSFERLFEPSPEVRTVPYEAIVGLPSIRRTWGSQPVDLLAQTDDHVTWGFVSWWLRPDLYPAHAALQDELAPALAALVPAAPIRERVAAFKAAHFRPQMIGVHLRRGDFHTARPDVVANTAQVIARIAEHLVTWPHAGILLATDDGAAGGEIGAGRSTGAAGKPAIREGVRETLVRRFGSRVVSATPRTLDRSAPEAIEDALVELLLLRETQAVIGTEGSSFSALAAFGRDVPFDRPRGKSLRWHRLELWSDRLGATPHIYKVARRFLGHEPSSFFLAWRAVRHAIGASRPVIALRAITGIRRRS